MRQNKKNTKKDIRKNVQNLNVTLLGLRVFLSEKAKLVSIQFSPQVEEIDRVLVGPRRKLLGPIIFFSHSSPPNHAHLSLIFYPPSLYPNQKDPKYPVRATPRHN